MKSVCIWSFYGTYFPTFGPEKLRIWALFTQFQVLTIANDIAKNGLYFSEKG